MKKNWEFTPELGIFLALVTVIAIISVGYIYYAYIRYYLKLNVTSWWRSPKKNQDVGGVSNSLHMIGLAWDVTPVTDENFASLRNAGLRVIDEGDHLHAQIV